MSLRPRRDANLQEDYLDKAPNKQMKKIKKKRKQPHEDGRYENMTVNKVRQQQRREYVLGA